MKMFFKKWELTEFQFFYQICHYIEEKFVQKQSETIRKFAGYTNDLIKLSNSKDKDIALNMYFYDEYLQKQ